MKSSLKHNIVANYVGQLYVVLIGIVMIPVYIRYMGVEAYGLVGFYSVLQTWFTLLDLGFTPVMSRETARFRGGALTALDYRNLVRALEGLFAIVAVVGGVSLYFASSHIAKNWLSFDSLLVDDVKLSIQLMSIIISLRWMSTLYRGVITGAEKIVLLNVYNAIIATVRFLGVLLVLKYFSPTPIAFFFFQAAIATCEILCLVILAYRVFPPVPYGVRLLCEFSALRPVIKLSFSIAFTSAVWVLITQTDKLVLSKVLSLSEYGYFTLAVTSAGIIIVLGGAVGSAIMPRMTRLEAEGETKQLVNVYREGTQLVAVMAGALAVTILFYAKAILFVWTGDLMIAEKAAPVFSLYALGNAFLTISAFPYYLQYAKGDMRLHLMGNVFFVLFLLPMIVVFASMYGAVGAGCVWLGINILWYAAWLPFVHRKFVPGLNNDWYKYDTSIIYVSLVIIGYCMHAFLPDSVDRITELLLIAFSGVVTLCVGVISASFLRKRLFRILVRMKGNVSTRNA